MNNVLDTSAERQPLTLDEAEDAILARWEDPDEKASDDETEAALEIEEETTDQHRSLTRKTTTRSTLRKKPTPKRTKKLTIKRRTTMKLLKLKYWLTTLKSKSHRR